MMLNLIVLSCVASVLSLDNGVARTPPLLYSTFERGCNFDENYIRTQANLLISTGLAARGFRTVLMDDCWQGDRDPKTNELRADPTKFPSGLQTLIKIIHDKGLMIGLSTDIGSVTRLGRPGSLNFQKTDVSLFALWGIDMIKIDNSQNLTNTARQSFTLMSQYILETRKKIIIMINNDGKQQIWSWGGAIANVWRTASEIQSNWQSLTRTIDQQYGLEVYSAEGAWNDPGSIKFDLPANEFTVQFVMWMGLKAPLAIQSPIESLSKEKLFLFLNDELIGINQDELKRQMRLIRRQQFQKGCQQIWGGPLLQNRYLLIFLNEMAGVSSMSISLKKQVGLTQVSAFWIRDPVNRINLGSSSSDTFVLQKIAGHSVQVRVLNF